MNVCYNFLIFLLILVLNLCIYCDTKVKAISGPYRSSIVDVRVCAKPDRPYVKKPPITLKQVIIKVSNNSLLTGNMTITTNTKNVKLRIRSSLWESGVWTENFFMNDVGCHGMLVYLFCTATGVKYDRKECMFLKGQYSLKQVDINAVQHIMISKMTYGRLLWRVELYNPWKGTYFCYEYEIITEPS